MHKIPEGCYCVQCFTVHLLVLLGLRVGCQSEWKCVESYCTLTVSTRCMLGYYLQALSDDNRSADAKWNVASLHLFMVMLMQCILHCLVRCC